MKSIFALLLVVASAIAIPTQVKPITVEEARTARGMRIVGGFQASPGQFPHQTRVLGVVSGGTFVVCGGTIISEEHILTASHCTAGLSEFRCGFGSIEFENPQVTLVSSRKLEHPSYNPLYLHNDIALLQLPQRLSFTNLIAPASLPTRSQQGNSFVNERVQTSGFGLTQDGGQISNGLNYVYLRVIGNSECSAVYGPTVVQGFTLCTMGYDINTQSICTGDTGGPLILQDRTLIGVASFVSSNGCSAGDPAGFARVTNFLDWISDNTGIAIRP